MNMSAVICFSDNESAVYGTRVIEKGHPALCGVELCKLLARDGYNKVKEEISKRPVFFYLNHKEPMVSSIRCCPIYQYGNTPFLDLEAKYEPYCNGHWGYIVKPYDNYFIDISVYRYGAFQDFVFAKDLNTAIQQMKLVGAIENY